MEAIRSIQTVKNGEIYLQLPQQFWGQEVEVIVLPALQQAPASTSRKKSLRGALKQYANPELIAQEQEAWATLASEKHDHR
ncbi:hypothetical protein [Synechococcus elongatus]|uniref:hypothetical protein n=1 Tax=Synechococcus elongatus TaxID=32046 RepID=UPI000F7DEED2|nr:hypothetical protein [Synechococcus elongatus]